MNYKLLSKKYDKNRLIYSDIVIWLAIVYNSNKSYITNEDVDLSVNKGKLEIKTSNLLMQSINLNIKFTEEQEKELNEMLSDISKEEEPLILGQKYFTTIFNFYDSLPQPVKTLQKIIEETIDKLRDQKVYHDFLVALNIIADDKDNPLNEMTPQQILDNMYLVDAITDGVDE